MVLPLVLPDAPMVLPPLLLLLDVSEEPLLAAGVLDELELVLGDDEEPGVEPLAPMEVPLLGADELDELVEGCELLVLLSLLLDPDADGVLLDPEAPIVLVAGSLAPGAGEPAAGAVPPLALGEELLLLELWATARPPNASAAAAARLVRVILVALMLNSLIDMLGNAPAWRAG